MTMTKEGADQMCGAHVVRGVPPPPFDLASPGLKKTPVYDLYAPFVVSLESLPVAASIPEGAISP
jgi:hypothetical protein